MVKTVFSRTDEVVAIWAAQSQDFARTGSNTRCEGRKLISYATCIAQLVETVTGETVALIDAGGYGTTTAVVIGQARSHAKAKGLRIFTVQRAEPLHLGNLKDYEGRIASAVASVERARHPEAHRQRARAVLDEATAYSDAFNCGWSYDGPQPESVLSKSEREA